MSSRTPVDPGQPAVGSRRGSKKGYSGPLTCRRCGGAELRKKGRYVPHSPLIMSQGIDATRAPGNKPSQALIDQGRLS
jgi:hypothetical protein